MDANFDNLLSSINNLSKSEQDKIFYFLLYNKLTISPDSKELVEFMTASSERLKQWTNRTDKVIDECDKFFNELDK